MNEEYFEVLLFSFQLLGPRYLPLQHHVSRVHVVQVGPFSQQEHPSTRKQTLNNLPINFVLWVSYK